jgi:glycerol-3-phosphate dehydrogenase
LQQAVYFDTPDKRMIFAIPREGCTYIGTTDTNYAGNKNRIQLNQDDVNYLVHAFNDLFPGCRLRSSDVISSWVGLRPLIHEEGKSPSELSRKDELFLSPSGMISIAGGKLTGYRLMAKRVVNEVAKRISKVDGRKVSESQTQSIVLSGGDFNDEQAIIEFKDMLCGLAKQVNCSFNKIDEWVNRYGREAEQIVEIAFALWPEISEKESVPDSAEMHYAIHNEMCLHPSDYFIRRTSTLYFHRETLLKNFEVLYPWFVETAQLDKGISNQYANEFMKEMDSVLDFK